MSPRHTPDPANGVRRAGSLGYQVNHLARLLAHTLRRRERDHLIHRTPDPGDRRRTRITVTDHAQAIKNDLLKAVQTTNATATRGLSDTEVTAFMTTLTHIITNLEADLDPVDGPAAEGRAHPETETAAPSSG